MTKHQLFHVRTVRPSLAIVGVSLMVLSAPTVASAASVEAFSDSRIINGQSATEGEAPFVTAFNVPDGFIGEGFDGQDDNHCGGALIAPDKVLSAAHCFATTPQEIITAQVGSVDRNGGETADIESVWIHPEYTSTTSGYDVAVVTLDREVSAPPAEINIDPAANAEGNVGTVYGWGVTETGAVVDQLRKVDVPLASDQDCADSYGTYDPFSMLCAGFVEGGRDACQGDSGGPLMVDGRVAGIVSFGRGCALERFYGVYARVSSFTNEIQAQL